jgi:hypothetical protein
MEEIMANFPLNLPISVCDLWQETGRRVAESRWTRFIHITPSNEAFAVTDEAEKAAVTRLPAHVTQSWQKPHKALPARWIGSIGLVFLGRALNARAALCMLF